MPWLDETEPLETMRSLLESNWVSYQEIPKPSIIIANDPEEPISRIDLNFGDYMVITSPSAEQVRYRGNVSYIDRIFPIMITCYTKESRQRMRNMYKEVRAICLIHKHTFPHWHFIRLLSGTREYFNTDLNLWRGEIQLQVESHGVLAETSI